MRQLLVLFDFDGTLVDSHRRVTMAMRETFAQQGLTCPADEKILALVGLQPATILGHLRPDLDPELRQEMAKNYVANAFRLCAENKNLEPPFPGAVACLESLKAEGHLLGLVTGKSKLGLDQSIENLSWGHYFHDIRPGDSGPGKPDPTLILRAMAAMKKGEGETIMVGDTTFDMEMSVRAGVTPVGVDWGHHKVADLKDAGAALIIGSFDGLLDFVRRHQEA